MAGRPPDVSDQEILSALREAKEPVLSGSEVADLVDLGRQGAYQRLKELEGRDLVYSKKIGNSLAWWISETGQEYLADEFDANVLEGNSDDA